MKPYPSYKDSGAAWMGQIPDHWGTIRAKWLFAEVSDKNHPDEQLLSATQDRGVFPRDELENRVVMPMGELAGFKLVKVGDFVISLRSFQGGIEYSTYQGLVSPAYVVLRQRIGLHRPYFKYLFKSNRFIQELNTAVSGIRQGKNIVYDDFARLVVPVPLLDEQENIAAFLQANDQEIRKFIANKRRTIELLKEQKAALINRAVTRGLDPSVTLKPSGIPWLGDIPAHWEQKPAKYHFREVDERSETGKEELLSVSHITGITPRSEKDITMFMAESYEGFKTCQAGDLVINIMWAWMGALGVSQFTGIVSSSYGVYRLRDSSIFHPAYLDHLLRTRAYTAEYQYRSKGIRSSRLRMYSDDFFGIPILQPPMDEQRQIVGFVVGESTRIDKAIAVAEREIELMNEYRTALISAAVTGKIDVRGAETFEVSKTSKV